MIRQLFSYFRGYCARCNLDPSKYRITITPLTAQAEAELKYQWSVERDHMTAPYWKDKPGSFYEGFIYGVPFKIENRE